MVGMRNIFVETSLFSTRFSLARLVREVGAEQILYGTDHPFSLHEIESLKIELADISEEDKNKIFFKNAQNLFNLE